MNSSPRCFNSHAQTVYRKLKAFILGHPAQYVFLAFIVIMMP